MAYEINSQPLLTMVRCRECRASIEINSDSRRLVETSIAEFQKLHLCDGKRAQESPTDRKK